MNTLVDCLIIGSDPEIRDQLKAYLGQHRFVVREADTLVKALALALERQPDVAFVDIDLPDTQGADAVAILHKFCKEIAIVAFTGQDDLGVALDCVRAGAVDFISRSGRHSLVEDIATRLRLAKYSGGRGSETRSLELHDQLERRLDNLLEKIPTKNKK